MKLYLVLEDDPVTLRLACGAVDKAGFFSLATTTLAEARQAIEVWPVDGALVDLALPDGTGMDFVRDLRAAYGPSGPPVLICTADSKRETVARAIQAGANDYTVKPFNLRELSYRLRRLMDPVPPRWDAWVEIWLRTDLTPAQHSGELDELQERVCRFAETVATDPDPGDLQELWSSATHLGHRTLARLLGDLVEGTLTASPELAARLRREGRAVELFNIERARGVGRVDWTPDDVAAAAS